MNAISGSAPVTYLALIKPQNVPVGNQIAQDIANASFIGQSPQLDRVFIFKWEDATIYGDDNSKVCKVSTGDNKPHYVI